MSGRYSCLFVSPFLNELLKIFIQVFLVVTFLSLFFFLYVVKVEKEIFQSQIDTVVDSIFTDLQHALQFLTPGIAQKQMNVYVSSYLDNVKINTGNVSQINAQNEEVITRTKNVVFVFALILFACVFVVFILRFCVDMMHSIAANLVVLACIAVTEYLFLNLVSRNYIAANPNHVKLYFATQVQAYAQWKNKTTTPRTVLPTIPITSV